MDIDTVVMALRDAPNYNAGFGTSTLEGDAADLIECLQAQLAAVESRNKELECAYSAYDGSALQRADQHIEDQENAIKNLREQLAASQRRAQDARNELCLKCGRYHEAHNGACDGCRWKG